MRGKRKRKAAAKATKKPMKSPQGDVKRLRSSMLKRINAERAKIGLHQLTLSKNQSAQLHAQDMIVHRYYSHTGIDGSSAPSRYVAAGGSTEDRVDETMCEDLYPSNQKRRMRSSERDLEMLMERTHGSLMASSPHEAIIKGGASEVAIGFAWNDKRFVVVQAFIYRARTDSRRKSSRTRNSPHPTQQGRRPYVSPTIQRTAGQIKMPIHLRKRRLPTIAPVAIRRRRGKAFWVVAVVFLLAVIVSYLYLAVEFPSSTDAMMRDWANIFHRVFGN